MKTTLRGRRLVMFVVIIYTARGNAIAANSDAKFAVFVESICRAYNSGELSQNVKFDGIVPEQWGQMRGEQCAWMRTTPLVEISSHRDDVDCQMCDISLVHHFRRHK
mmetsp:Transcript_2450/g.4410  ORF Transcript_2450/g.4410 Transcript_2450/m.4410 type:complete len:107 (-) Transcript_2450:41-361(-)